MGWDQFYIFPFPVIPAVAHARRFFTYSMKILIRAADAALCMAKESGWNCVQVASNPEDLWEEDDDGADFGSDDRSGESAMIWRRAGPIPQARLTSFSRRNRSAREGNQAEFEQPVGQCESGPGFPISENFWGDFSAG